jgi:hypothetical protein
MSRYLETFVDSQFLIQSSFLSLDGGHHTPGVSDSTEFQVPDTLPCASRQLAVLDGNRHAGTDESGFDVGGHVVRSLSAEQH